MTNKPVISDIVVQHIKKSLRKGKLTPGQKLSETNIAAELQISRAPIREAFNQLTGLGLLISDARHGKRVNILSSQQIEDAYTMGGVVCGLSVSRCLEQYSKADFARMERILESLRKVTENNGSISEHERLCIDFNVAVMSYPYQRWYRTPVDFCAVISWYLYYPMRRRITSPYESYATRRLIFRTMKKGNPAKVEYLLRNIHEALGKRMSVAGYDQDPEMLEKNIENWLNAGKKRVPRSFIPGA